MRDPVQPEQILINPVIASSPEEDAKDWWFPILQHGTAYDRGFRGDALVEERLWSLRSLDPHDQNDLLARIFGLKKVKKRENEHAQGIIACSENVCDRSIQTVYYSTLDRCVGLLLCASSN